MIKDEAKIKTFIFVSINEYKILCFILKVQKKYNMQVHDDDDDDDEYFMRNILVFKII